MSKVTIEKIQGKQYTVMWQMDILGNLHDYKRLDNYIGYNFYTAGDELIATALPALPRYPTAEDVELLHLYATHGLILIFTSEYSGAMTSKVKHTRNFTHVLTILERNYYPDKYEITHAIDKEGNRVEVAICEKS